jgi:hypothetical protein
MGNANLGKSVMDTLAMIRMHSWKKALFVHGKSKLTDTKKKARQAKSKVKSMLVIFFDIKGIVHKEFIMAGQTVTSAYYILL